MSLFREYIRERRTNCDVIENSQGFIAFRYFVDQKELQVMELFVLKDSRKAGVARMLGASMLEYASMKGWSPKLLTATVDTLANNASENVRMALNYGFKLICTENQMIILSKELGE